MNKIGNYTFTNSDLLNMALTHSSYSENNYERLEFLGDSILDFLIADILYKDNKLKEAKLTRARANIVSEEALSVVFDTLNISDMVKLGKSCTNITRAIKADVIESLIAVIYLESGLNACVKFINDNFDLKVKDYKDYKTQFQEYAQKNKLKYEYKLIKTEGPAHNLLFYIELVVNNVPVSNACAKSKVEAEKECARLALIKL